MDKIQLTDIALKIIDLLEGLDPKPSILDSLEIINLLESIFINQMYLNQKDE